MKIVKEVNGKLVVPNDMQDGEFGIILRWDVKPAYVGRVVQKYGNTHLITLGERSGMSYPTGGSISDNDCQIEILPPGTLLEI